MFDWVKKKINVFQYTIIYNDKNRKSKIWKTLNTLHSVSYLSGVERPCE